MAGGDVKDLVKLIRLAKEKILMNGGGADDGGVHRRQQLTPRPSYSKYKTLADGTKRLVSAAKPAKVEYTGEGYSMTTSQLSNAITIKTQTNSQVFSVSVETDNPKKSAAAANTIASVFKKRIKKIMNVNNVTIVARATTPSEPSSPNVKLFTLAGAVLGLLISFMVVLMRDLMDTSVRNNNFMDDEMGLTNLGQITHINLDDGFSIKRRSQNTQTRRV